MQADSIVPNIVNPQTWNRYSYAANNPILYNDPDGHCGPLCTGLIGLVVGVAVNYTIQAVKNYQSGKSFSESVNLSNIDKKSLAVAAVGGFVAGATMGLASGAAGFFATNTAAGQVAAFTTEYVIGGAVANAAAGQAEALASAKLDANGKIIYGQPKEDFYTKAYAAGYMDKEKFIDDLELGATLGFLLGIGKASLGVDPGVEKYFRSRPPGPFIRPIASALEWSLEYMNQESKYRQQRKESIME